MVGIGTDSPTSRLAVIGLIESTGPGSGIKFPDATIQTTAFDPNQVVRSLNGLQGDLTLAAGTNITVTSSGGTTLTIAAPNLLTSVSHNTTLTGNGTATLPLSVADGGVGTAQLANNGVTAGKIASGQVLKGLNGLTDQVVLAAGPNVTITSNGNTLSIGTTTSDPALSAFRKDLSLHIDEGVGILDATIPIPANKRLIIEYLSMDMASPNEANPLLFLTTHIGTAGDVRYSISPLLVGDRSFAVDHLVRIYADGSIQVHLSRLHPDFASEGTLTISGHLVDLP
jgi:hypothetical protein